jgi:NADP-dependent 3-hydroxy acid dehydrogenase YdfG
MQALANRAIKVHGRIDVMLNNAGVMPLEPLEMLRVDEWHQTIDVNIKGVLHGNVSSPWSRLPN